MIAEGHARTSFIVIHAAILAFTTRAVSAQDRPFVFSLTTASDVAKPQVLVDYDVGIGERAFHSDTENGPKQRVGIQASLGHSGRR